MKLNKIIKEGLPKKKEMSGCKEEVFNADDLNNAYNDCHSDIIEAEVEIDVNRVIKAIADYGEGVGEVTWGWEQIGIAKKIIEAIQNGEILKVKE